MNIITNNAGIVRMNGTLRRPGLDHKVLRECVAAVMETNTLCSGCINKRQYPNAFDKVNKYEQHNMYYN